MSRFTCALLLLLVCHGCLWAQEGDKSVKPISVARKVALVIGNSNYKYIAGVPPAVRDADDLAGALRTLRFDVVDVRNDLTGEQLIEGSKRLLTSAAHGFSRAIWL